LKLNEYNRPIFELFADDALGWKTQAIAVESQRCFEVIDTNSDDCDSRLHMLTISQAALPPVAMMFCATAHQAQIAAAKRDLCTLTHSFRDWRLRLLRPRRAPLRAGQ
jgi:hypothetical protein